MGTCVSAHRDTESFGSKTDKLVIPSPTKYKPMIIGEVGLKPQWPPSQSATTFRDFGSKDETFFDSHAWLDSDCEDDFMSVKGDFTPSCGSTPVHHNFSTPQVSGALFKDQTPGSPPEPTPSKKKTRLSDLFKDSLQSNQDVEEEQNTLGNQKGTNGVYPVYSSERTPNGDFKPKKERYGKSVQCCLPSLLSSRNFSEKKKKSPVHSIG